MERMLEVHGQDVVDDMLARRHQVEKWDRTKYIELIELYKQKTQAL